MTTFLHLNSSSQVKEPAIRSCACRFHPVPSARMSPSLPPTSTHINNDNGNDNDYDTDFSPFGPQNQLTTILEDRPLCLPDAALRPPAAKHSHNSRLAASPSPNHFLHFPRWKDTHSSSPAIRYRITPLERQRLRVYSPDARYRLSPCGNMQNTRTQGLLKLPHAKCISTAHPALDLQICIHSSCSLSLKVSSPDMGRRATEPTRPDRRWSPPFLKLFYSCS
ncbi:hypothetical protein CORC01_07157 [Colletotrichum orchidophilum]|uniref:Uncharacterized protein n=1 Tax=Colletotrichum orchidophilum TaxID=1209926 RepID=A0A1G4B8D8_9PEZI|nr:uncharacterized protein CORC01_07157 [Colletotrichum orchidophilum]OHE97542.1 hypothetical protein CORC01_07157 [Colletotrichum orchidophilum]